MPHTLTRRARFVAIITALLVMSPLLIMMQNARAGETQVYKWVDKNGTVSFGSRPPPSVSSQSMTVETTDPDTSALPASNPDTSMGTGKTDKKHKKNAEKPKKQPQPQMSAEQKNRLCMIARRNLASIISHGRVRQRNTDGSFSYLSAQQRQQRLTIANRNIAKYCN